ncbi:hypothetical protein BHU72_06095 [Desulfuribacillus stibiiarsenatis]|uniref:UPF0145 protein BHU72_06095 n=1 Tax=Desulfuribacillus stibiiarsenatis TaxID=1390249 RepID=A0A1E5L5D6_9FIRM|nr:YbjQ family protein [Desulfuribacillus stibiiarsenatis]OEH85179.1 hypothetical protein BHU72_06095 [Desulfuribacillus stibiiarsenatis]
MILVNTETIPGKKIVRTIGYVKGSTIQARHIGQDIIAGLRNIVGGEIKEYTNLMDDARKRAVQRMVAEAEARGANAIVNLRFMNAQIAQGAAEILVYGTALVVEDEV